MIPRQSALSIEPRLGYLRGDYESTSKKPRNQAKSLRKSLSQIHSELDGKLYDGCLGPVPEPDADSAGGAYQFALRIDRLEMANGMGYVDRDDRVAMQGDHHAETSGGNQIYRGHAEARRQDAVEGRRCASALNVPQHADSYFFTRAAGDGIADQIADGTTATVLFHLRRKLHAFGHNYNSEMLAGSFALGNIAADVLNGERDFRDENDVGAPGDAGLQRDPAAVAAHHLNYHNAMMRRGRGVNLVDGVGDGVQRGIETECNLRGREIVVDSLGHADDLHSFLKKFVADLLGSIAADGNNGIDAQLAGVGDDLARNVAGHFLSVLVRS